MLQRIQSIYLLAATLVIFALFLFPISHNIYLSGVPSTIKITGIYQDVNGAQKQITAFPGLSIITAIVGLIPLAIIFLYNNRKQQVNAVIATILIVIAYSWWLSHVITNAASGFQMSTNNFGVGMFLSSISIVMLILAMKAIQRDEKLVRSADRLR